MNICFPSLSYPLNGEPTSGVGSQVRLLAHALIDAGNTVSVIDLTTNQASLTSDDRGVQVYRVTVGKLHWFIGKLPLIGKTLALPVLELEYSLAVWRGVRKADQSHRLDLIEGTETGMLLLALFWKKSPVIIRLHGEQYTFRKYTPEMKLTAGVRLSRVLQRIALRRAKLLISPSYAHAREIHNELGALQPPIVMVPNSLTLSGLERNGHHERTSKTVLYAGRIERRKGIKTLLRAAAQTREALPEARFLFAGDFHSSLSEAEFQQLVRANNLDQNIDLFGPVPWTTLTNLYKCCVVAVLPSHYETFGLAALEPMAFGTPVIASDNSALPEVVVANVNGKLVESGDANALASAMIELLTNPDTCAQMGKAAIEHAARFDVRTLFPLTELLYRWCDEDSWTEINPHIFFSPHPDDVVLSCGGMIYSLLSQNKAVKVITVFANDSEADGSAFARHLHAKWAMPVNAAKHRRQEDCEALQALGISDNAHWDYVEAPYRLTADGNPLYGTYDELRGELAPDDCALVDILAERILGLDVWSQDPVLYFPLSLGRHVDHQILFETGRRLVAAGKHIRFYEDYPYAESYDDEPRRVNWLPRTFPISLQAKLIALGAYRTQMPGLGGSLKNLERRLRGFSSRLGRATSERYWELITPVNPSQNGNPATVVLPLSARRLSPRLRDFMRFLRTFRWHHLDEMLPPGSGDCIDVGCGAGRHRRLIESRGYRWIGLDRTNGSAAKVLGDAAAVPVQSQSKAAVVAWQILEYVERPEQVMTEAARVLEHGGVFCGSVSFLEPVHGRTYFNISPVILEKLLREHGFADIEIKPGLNGFVLMLWTWLRRSGIPLAEYLAIPAAFATFVPLATLIYCLSWLGRRLGFGRGHMMRWLSQAAPLEFAGHLMFSARKRGRAGKCT